MSPPELDQRPPQWGAHCDEMGRGNAHCDEMGRGNAHCDEMGRGNAHCDEMGRGTHCTDEYIEEDHIKLENGHRYRSIYISILLPLLWLRSLGSDPILTLGFCLYMYLSI